MRAGINRLGHRSRRHTLSLQPQGPRGIGPTADSLAVKPQSRSLTVRAAGSSLTAPPNQMMSSRSRRSAAESAAASQGSRPAEPAAQP